MTESFKHVMSFRTIMTIQCKKVEGKKKGHHVKIYTLSTCGWCKKTKELLKALDVEYEYVDVDTLSGDDIQEASEEVKKFNPYRTYPTIIIDNGKHVILGFNDKEIKEKLR
jgi:glutaredoxin-like protein NrdH